MTGGRVHVGRATRWVVRAATLAALCMLGVCEVAATPRAGVRITDNLYGTKFVDAAGRLGRRRVRHDRAHQGWRQVVAPAGLAYGRAPLRRRLRRCPATAGSSAVPASCCTPPTAARPGRHKPAAATSISSRCDAIDTAACLARRRLGRDLRYPRRRQDVGRPLADARRHSQRRKRGRCRARLDRRRSGHDPGHHRRRGDLDRSDERRREDAVRRLRSRTRSTAGWSASTASFSTPPTAGRRWQVQHGDTAGRRARAGGLQLRRSTIRASTTSPWCGNRAIAVGDDRLRLHQRPTAAPRGTRRTAPARRSSHWIRGDVAGERHPRRARRRRRPAPCASSGTQIEPPEKEGHMLPKRLH